MTDWSDVAARARGLSGQLLTPDQWRELCGVRELGRLGEQLAALGCATVAPESRPVSPARLELAVRRRAGGRLRLLARWAAPRAARLEPLFVDEDRRSLRALMRGAVAGISADERLATLMPTPLLPIRALTQLAHTPDILTIAALLMAWRHPFAQALSEEARRHRPDLFRIDVAIARAFAAHALWGADQADAPMRLFVERTIDIENAWNAIALTGGPSNVDPAAVFIDGGRLIAVDDLVAAVAGDWLGKTLHARIAGTAVAAAVAPGARAHEDRAIEVLADEFRRMALHEPLSTAPMIAFALRQRIEIRVLFQIVWGVALGAPQRVIEEAVGVAP